VEHEEMMMRTMRRETTMTKSRARTRATALAIGLGLVLAACAGEADSAGNGATAGDDGPTATAGAVIDVADDATFGPILTDGSGMTLYLFTADSPGVSTCVDGCLATWPPLLTDGEPSAQGTADATLLGTLTRDDGSVQVTYDGWPLYFFAADMAPGDVAGQGVNDVWFVIAPDGTAIEDDPDDDADAADEGGMGGAPASDGAYGYGY
jgi:predicted lipoprotein with Yx(FWY)xxD motif